MVDNSVSISCPHQKSLLAEWALASWTVMGTLWSQDLGLWNQMQIATMGHSSPFAQVRHNGV